MLSDNRDIVEDDGINLPLPSFPTDVARSSGSGCSSVSTLVTSSSSICGGDRMEVLYFSEANDDERSDFDV